MKFSRNALWALPLVSLATAIPTANQDDVVPQVVEKRAAPTGTGFAAGQPEDANGKGGPVLGG
jgi:hypothetical protein